MIIYPNFQFAMRPVPHSDDLPVPTPPVNKDFLSSSDEEMPSREDSGESISLEILSLHNQEQVAMSDTGSRKEDLNNLARNLYSVKTAAQSSRLLGLNSGT